MASVEFYEQANKLQQKLREHELRRLQLEQEYNSIVKDKNRRDENNMKVVDQVWNFIKDREERQRKSNEELLEHIFNTQQDLQTLRNKAESLRVHKDRLLQAALIVYPDFKDALYKRDLPNVQRLENYRQRVQQGGSSLKKLESFQQRESKMKEAQDIQERQNKLKEAQDLQERQNKLKEAQDIKEELNKLKESSIKNVSKSVVLTQPKEAKLTLIRRENSAEKKTASEPIFVPPLHLSALHSTNSETLPENEILFTGDLSSNRSRGELRKSVTFSDDNLHTRDEKVKQRSLSNCWTSENDLRLSLDSNRSSSSAVLTTELTINGLYHLIDFIEKELENNVVTAKQFYRSSIPNDRLTREIVGLANRQQNLTLHSASSISMVLLDQLLALCERLPGHCLLADSVVKHSLSALPSKLSVLSVSNQLSNSNCKSLWQRLMQHLEKLVRHDAGTPIMIAELFASIMLHKNSRLEFDMIQLLEKMLMNVTPLTQRDSDTSSFSLTPRVKNSSLAAFSSMKVNADSFSEDEDDDNEDMEDKNSLKLTKNPELASNSADFERNNYANQLMRKKDDMDYEESLNFTGEDHSLRTSAAYRKMVDSDRAPLKYAKSLSSSESDSEIERLVKCDDMVQVSTNIAITPRGQSLGPTLTDIKSSTDHSSSVNTLRNTKDLLKSVLRRDSDVSDLSISHTTQDDPPAAKEDEDEDFDFYS